MTRLWVTALALALLPLVCVAGFTDHFTAPFRQSVDSALAHQDPAERAQSLIAAMHSAKNDEVFFVLPLLFPPPILGTARGSGACVKEVDATYGDIKEYLALSGAAQEAFPTTHAQNIRPHVDALIKCICPYYIGGGKLYFPGQQPNNSFKPKPLRGSA